MKRIVQHLALAAASAMLADAGPLDAKVTAIRVAVVQSPTFDGRSFGSRVEECHLCGLAPALTREETFRAAPDPQSRRNP